jgi:hypothetical protein
VQTRRHARCFDTFSGLYFEHDSQFVEARRDCRKYRRGMARAQPFEQLMQRMQARARIHELAVQTRQMRAARTRHRIFECDEHARRFEAGDFIDEIREPPFELIAL